MPDYTIVGTAITVTWGSSGVVSGIGEVVGVDINNTGEVRDIKNGDGNTIIKVLFDEMKEGTIEVITDTGATLPSRGGLLTVNAETEFIVEDVREIWTAGEEKKASISVKRHEYLSTV